MNERRGVMGTDWGGSPPPTPPSFFRILCERFLRDSQHKAEDHASCDDAIQAYRVEITGLQTQCFRLLRLIGQAVDGEMGWQDVTELQTFLREGVVG